MSAQTDVVAILKSYLTRCLSDVQGMKVLILDADTIRIVSTVLSQSEILENEVFLVQRLDAVEQQGSHLPHLKAVCFLRPTRENVARIRRELKDPRFGQYHIFFTNRVEDMRIQDLADVDTQELIQEVQEYYGDFVALAPHHFIIPIARSHVALQPTSWDFSLSSDVISKLTEGITSVLLSLRRRFIIRYQRGSEMCERLAQSLHHLTTIEERELFDFGTRGGDVSPLLLIIDRRDDPVTPLLSQWTYQAMIHEILGIDDHRVSLRHVTGVRPEMAEAVLSPVQDDFFATNMYSNFGDIGMAVKGLVDSCSTGSRPNLQSIDDMTSFVENLPEFSHQQALTWKHVTLMSELSHAVDRRGLMRVSGVEQDIVSQAPNASGHYEEVIRLVCDAMVQPTDKLRLVLLFALRYEKEARQHISALMSRLEEWGVAPDLITAGKVMLRQCSADKRVMDVFSDRSITSRFATLAKQHLQGVENVYTQHVPPLISLLEKAVKGKLVDVEYPKLGGRSSPTAPKGCRLVVVFVVGGTTFEEAKAIADLNTSADRGEGWSAGARFVLGGTLVQNSTTFLKDFRELALNERYHKREEKREREREDNSSGQHYY